MTYHKKKIRLKTIERPTEDEPTYSKIAKKLLSAPLKRSYMRRPDGLKEKTRG